VDQIYRNCVRMYATEASAFQRVHFVGKRRR